MKLLVLMDLYYKSNLRLLMVNYDFLVLIHILLVKLKILKLMVIVMLF